jgi:hypothetical protein
MSDTTMSEETDGGFDPDAEITDDGTEEES